MEKLYRAQYNSEIGILEITGTESELLSVIFSEDSFIPGTGKRRADGNGTGVTSSRSFRERTRPRETEEYAPLIKEALKQIDEYFKGLRRDFSIKFRLEGTEFQKRVLKELESVPYGSTVTYKEIAAAVGDKRAARAVGNSVNKNKFALLIPCHRVIAANGSLSGYAWGLWRKEWLLKKEQSHLVRPAT